MSDLAYTTLLRRIDGLAAGLLLTIDDVRDELDAAGLSSAEKSGAFRTAAHEGYITGVFLSIPGLNVSHPVHAAVPSTHEAGKGRYVKVWRRTAKDVPAHVCCANFVESQEDSWDNGDSKTAPGVASTTAGGLAPTPLNRKEA